MNINLSPSTTDQVKKVRNPVTGRSIEIGKGTYNKLIEEGYVLKNNELIKPTVTPTFIPTIKPTSTRKIVSPTPIPRIVSPTRKIVSPTPTRKIVSPAPIPRIVSPTRKIVSPTPIPRIVSQKSKIWLGPAPETSDLRKEFLETLREERQKMCSICNDEYIKRISNLRGFKTEDYDTLKKRIVPACSRCVELIEQESDIARRNPNEFQSYRKYREATLQAKGKMNLLESEIRVKGIRLASAGSDVEGVNPEIFFPKVPE